MRARIRRRLGRDLRGRVDTDDLFQSTITDSLASLPAMRFESAEAFLAWLGRATERQVMDAARRHRAERRDVGREEHLPDQAVVPGALTSPTQGAVRGETRAGLARVIERLPDDERRAVHLRSYEDLTFQEMAERMGLPDRHAARSLYQRALKRMGDLFGEGAAPE